jgi:hypothetical protein
MSPAGHAPATQRCHGQRRGSLRLRKDGRGILWLRRAQRPSEKKRIGTEAVVISFQQVAASR